jgi:hypothetical protein
MTRWYPLEPADPATFTSGARVYRFPVRLDVPPERVWRSLTSEGSVADWGHGVRRVTWTSPAPFGVGTTREVELPLGAVTVRERFFRWDEGRGYSFHVTEANRPGLRLFAEDYEVVADGRGSLLNWTIALAGRPALAPAMPLLGPLTRVAFGKVARDAEKYFAAHP